MVKKHVMIVINSLSQGGAERVASILLENFYHDSAYTITLVLLENEIAYQIPEGLNRHILSSLNNQDSGMKKTLHIPQLAWRLHRCIQKEQPDVIVSFLYRADFVNVLAAYGHKKPVIVSERVNASSTYNNNSLNAKINKFLIKKLYPKADMVINVSQGTKDDLVENFGIEAKKQIVIYNPYDIQHIKNLSCLALDLPFKREHTIVAVSRFRPIKNIAMILRAFATLEPWTQLMLVGDGSEEVLLRSLSEELGIQKRVHFMGGQDNPYQYMAQASVYVSASRSEGFPNALVEAMICGCAIVSTDCPSGPREILAPQSDSKQRLESGFEEVSYGSLVALEDVQAMRDALQKMLIHASEYAQKGQQRINDFEVEHVYQQYQDAVGIGTVS